MKTRAAPIATCALVFMGCGGGTYGSATSLRPASLEAEPAAPTNVAAPGTQGPVTIATTLSEPNVPLTLVSSGTSALGEVTITRSHFYADTHAKARNAWRWLAVVRNARSELACDLTVKGEFVVQGGPPVTVFANVAAPPYRRHETSSVFRCVAPGDVGVASGLVFTGARPFSLASVTEIRYAVSGLSDIDLTPSDSVSLGDVRVVATERGRVVRGSVANGSRRMPFWETAIYPFNAEQMPLTEVVLRDPRTGLAPGDTWAFETPPFDAPFDGAYVFVRHGRAQ